ASCTIFYNPVCPFVSSYFSSYPLFIERIPLSQHSILQVWESEANFVYVRLKPNGSHSQDAAVKNLHQNLKAAGTLVREINGGLRITVATPDENARTLNRLQAALFRFNK
ncbi:MAG: hypothetical protein ACREPR_05475, partial [Brasilonema sp.]